MSSVLMIKNKGLQTSPNEFSAVQPGAMLKATNCSIDIDDIIEPRRGLDRYLQYASSSDRARRYTSYQSTLITAYSNGKIAKESGGAWVNFSGTYNDPDSTNARTRFLRAGSNLYFTTDGGVYRLDSTSSTPVLSGIPKGLDLQLSTTGASGFLSNNNQIGYRMVWGFRDANGTIFLGAPSGRATLANSSGGSRDISITFTIPSGITTSYFFQIYRSANSGAVGTEPSDEMGLVYENSPTAGEITAGLVTFTDSTPDSLRGATLYTSPSQEGIIQSNERPPVAEDIEQFSDCTFYANCESKQRRTLTLLSAAAITVNDTITIAGTTYTAKAAENIANREYLKATAGTAAQNIADTVNSLIRVINRNTTNTTVYAYLLSGFNDLPGQMLIEERGIGGASFAIVASAAGTAFNPVLPTSGTTVSSSSDDFQHQIFFSKPGKQEAVPLTNYVFAGSANNAIRRIKALGNSLFIYKEQEGIYRITGTYPNFTVELFDSSARLLAPDSLDVVNNQQWALTDQGVTIISETGTSVVSRPIEDQVLQQTGTALSQLKQYCFGVGYETDRKYILWTVSNSADTYATQAFVWNTFTKAWTKWDVPATTAFINPVDNKLYVGRGDNDYTLKERKTLTYTDIVDHSISVTISSASGTSIVLSSASGVEVGDIISQGSLSSLITAISSNTLTVADTLAGWTAASATVYKAYECELEYSAVTAGNPGSAKQWPEVAFLFRAARFVSATAGFATDASGSFEDVTILGSRVGLWGLFPWGESQWGSSSTSIPIRTYIPLEKQRGSLLRVRLKIRQGYSAWKLNGFSLPFRDTQSFKVAK